MPLPAIAAAAARLAASPQFAAMASRAIAALVGDAGLASAITGAAGSAGGAASAGAAGGAAASGAAAGAGAAGSSATAANAPRIVNIVQQTLVGAGMGAMGGQGAGGQGGTGGAGGPPAAGGGGQPPGGQPPATAAQPPGGQGGQGGSGGFDLTGLVMKLLAVGGAFNIQRQIAQLAALPMQSNVDSASGFLFGANGQGGFARLGEATANATGKGEQIRGLSRTVVGDMRLPSLSEALNPVEMAKWGAEMRANLIELPERLKQFGAGLVEGQRHLKDYSGQLSIAYARLDVERFQRSVRTAAATADSTERLTQAQSRLEEAKRPLEDLTTNVVNEITAGLANAVATGIERTLGPVIQAANRFLGISTSGTIESPLADLTRAIASGRFSGPLRPVPPGGPWPRDPRLPPPDGKPPKPAPKPPDGD